MLIERISHQVTVEGKGPLCRLAGGVLSVDVESASPVCAVLPKELVKGQGVGVVDNRVGGKRGCPSPFRPSQAKVSVLPRGQRKAVVKSARLPKPIRGHEEIVRRKERLPLCLGLMTLTKKVDKKLTYRRIRVFRQCIDGLPSDHGPGVGLVRVYESTEPRRGGAAIVVREGEQRSPSASGSCVAGGSGTLVGLPHERQGPPIPKWRHDLLHELWAPIVDDDDLPPARGVFQVRDGPQRGAKGSGPVVGWND